MPHKYFWIFLIVFVVLVGLYNFQTSPGFWFDEGIMAQAAKNIARDGVYGIQTAPGVFYTNNFWITTGYPVVFPTALFLKIFGISVWAARLAPLLYLVAFAVVSYFFIKKLYGFYPAAFTGLLLATFPPFYGNGKALLGEVPGLFWFVLGAFLYLFYKEKKNTRFLYVTAFAWGLAVATKPYFVLIIPGIVFLILFMWFKKQIGLRQVFGFATISLIPILLWAYFAFDISSPQNFGATISYFLNSYSTQTFDIFGNLFRFISESTPIHFSILALAVPAAFFVSVKNKKEYPLILIVFLSFVILAFLWYLKTPGWYRYFFPAHIVLLLLFSQALCQIAGRFFGAVILSSIIFFQGTFLFLNYNDFYGDSALKFSVWTKNNIPESASVLVINMPEAAFLLENKKLYQDIFISRNFSIKSSVFDVSEPDYIINADSKTDFLDYSLTEEIGGYKIYKKL